MILLSFKKNKGQNSDEYIAAGGTPLSEIIAQQQKMREANKKAAEQKELEKV